MTVAHETTAAKARTRYGASLALVPWVAWRYVMNNDYDSVDPPGSTPDDTLAAAAREGDRDAFGALFVRHRESIRKVVHVRVRDAVLTEELVQRTFTRALEGISSFRGDAAFSTWLYTIATNVVRNHCRENPAGRNVALEDVDLITTAFGTGKLVAREVRQKLAAAILELAPKQRQVVELHLIHGMGFREIASVTGSTMDTTRRNYSHAVAHLRAILLPPDSRE